MFGFKIPVVDIQRAISLVTLSGSFGLRRAFNLMLNSDPVKRFVDFFLFLLWRVGN